MRYLNEYDVWCSYMNRVDRIEDGVYTDPEEQRNSQGLRPLVGTRVA